MMENKYYTPTLEEFHIGFEYERFYSSRYYKDYNADPKPNSWGKCICTILDLISYSKDNWTTNSKGNTVSRRVSLVSKEHNDKLTEDQETLEKLNNGFSFRHLEDDIKYGEIRVKCLDKEDIEELGWTNYKKSVWDWYEIEKQFRLSSGHWGSRYILSHDRTNEFTTITDDDVCHNILIKADIGGSIDTIFEGTIKNKSELKKLMKQLGICQ